MEKKKNPERSSSDIKARQQSDANVRLYPKPAKKPGPKK